MDNDKLKRPELKLGVIGAGAMGGALIRGLLKARRLGRDGLAAYDPDPARQRELASLKLAPARDPREVMEAPVVVLAVKPQVAPAVLEGLSALAGSRHLVISIVAGLPLARLEAQLPEARLIRAMPNTPLVVQEGITALASGRRATSADLALALELFSALGKAVVVEERLLDAVTGLSGSGPAYVALFVEALADGGVKMGLPRELALTLAAQTVLGGARLLLSQGLHPALLKDQVASPGGTTIAGLHALEQGGFRGLVMDAVQAAVWRAQELSRD
jgi:pyrroline-5-carboxylate reductase